MPFRGSIDPKGTGRPDFTYLAHGTAAVVLRGGSVDVRRGSLGRVASLGTMGRVNYQGSLGHLRDVGSLARVNYIGTLNRVARVGSLAARYITGTPFFTTGTRHVAVGSTLVGDWINVERFRTKTFHAKLSMGGSFHIVTGFRGSDGLGGTGTYYSTRIGQGSYNIFSFTEAVRFARPVVRSGSVASGKGTATLMLNLQV